MMQSEWNLNSLNVQCASYQPSLRCSSFILRMDRPLQSRQNHYPDYIFFTILIAFHALLDALYDALDAPTPWHAACDALVVGEVARCVSVAHAGVLLAECRASGDKAPDASATAAVLRITCQHGIEWVFQWQRPMQSSGTLANLKLQLAPHLCRVARQISRLAQATQQASDLAHAVSVVETGILFIAASGQVLLANDKARTLLLASPAGLPETALEPLSNAMRDAQQERQIQHRRCKTATGETFFSVAPLPRPKNQPVAHDSMLVVVENTARGRIASLEQLMLLFGLSYAESVVAQLLALGNTPEEIAVLRDVRISTVRSQLSGILSKMEVRNQSALIRLVSLVPAVR
jgi:DNA-binding CsgD family transcriptional regulator